MLDTKDAAAQEVAAKLDKPKRIVTAQHKQAMSDGRRQSRIVNQYLSLIVDDKPKRGRQRTPETIQARITKIQERLPQSTPVIAVQLTSELSRLQSELATFEKKPDLSALEADFVSVAKEYSERKHITRSAWKIFGVSNEVLEKAGI